MALYDVQAPDGSVITIEGPDNASQADIVANAQALYKQTNKAPKKSAMDYVKDFGKSAASLADTGFDTASGTLDWAAYNLARAAGRSPEQATKETTSPKQPLGNLLGITQDPAYQNEASRQLMGHVGQGIENYVVNPVSQATGMHPADVSSAVGSAGLLAGPAMGRAGQAVGRAAYAAEPYVAGAAKLPVQAVKAPFQFAKGAYEGVTNPVYNEATSAMVPLREQYTPVPAAQRFMGQMPEVPPQSLEQLQTQARPTSELMTNPIDKFAKATAPVSPEGYPLVPLQGRGMEAWGERVGRGIRTNPGQALAEAGITALTGVPVKTISQGVSELAARHLANKTGFSPEFPQAVQAAQGRAGIQANMPTQQALPYNPTPTGPVNPETLYGGPSGMVGQTPQAVNQAEALARNAPQPIAPISPSATPAEISQQVAASKISPMNDPKNQAILDQIRARKQQPNTIQPVAPTEMPTVAPEATPTTSPVSKATEMNDRLAKLKADLESQGHKVEAPLTPAEIAEQKKMATMSAAETRGHILKEWVKGNRLAQAESLDTSKGAYGSSNLTKRQAEQLMKAGIDEIPVVEGATSKQVIEALHGYIEKTKPEMFKAKRGPKKKGPDNVSQMLTEGPSSSGKYSSKEEFEKASVFSKLKDVAHTGSYPQGDKIIHVEEINYGNIPKDVSANWEQTKTYATDKNGNRVPIGKEWTEADPEPLTSQLKKRFKKD